MHNIVGANPTSFIIPGFMVIICVIVVTMFHLRMKKKKATAEKQSTAVSRFRARMKCENEDSHQWVVFPPNDPKQNHPSWTSVGLSHHPAECILCGSKTIFNSFENK